jgi:OmpA-OmpF porin, OOP family
MTRRFACLIGAAFCAALMAGPVLALDLALPVNARPTVERNTSPDLYAAPIGVFEAGKVPVLSVEGDVRRGAWRLGSPGLTPLQVIVPLRRQLVDAGFEILLDCASAACGGFDFRFATETLPGPNMYVNIRAFHFVTAVRKTNGTVQEVVTVLSSTSATSAYIQIIQAGALAERTTSVTAKAEVPVPVGEAGPSRPTAQGDLASALLNAGHAVLSDLDFDTGTTSLGQGPFASLQALAELMRDQPDLRLALVGHTDSVGGLQANINISRERAQSVRQRLIDVHSISPSRLEAEAVGYLSPIATNRTEAGRTDNRRVEAVLLPAPN